MKEMIKPTVTVTEDNTLKIRACDSSYSWKSAASIEILPEHVPELIETLLAGKTWAEVCAKAQVKPEPESSPAIVVKEGAVSDEDEAPL